MVALLQRKATAMVISLVVAVISLPAITFAAIAPPKVKVLAPVTQAVRTPLRIAMATDGSYYVADPRNSGVLRYGPNGALLQEIKTSGVPQGVAVLSNGNVVVTQGAFAAIYDKTSGAEIRKLGTGAVTTPFGFANGVTVDGTGKIYVVDQVGNCIKVFTAAGEYDTQFGSLGSAPGSFSTPTGIAYEKVANQLVVVDTFNNRVQFLNLSGTPVSSIGSSGTGPLKFTAPQGVALEYSKGASPVLERIYVVDTFQSTVQVIDPSTSTGTFLSYLGDYGTANGQLVVPSDAVFDVTNSRLLVVNGFGNISVYGIDGGTSPTGTIAAPVLTVNSIVSVNTPSVTLTGTVSAGSTISALFNGEVFTGTVTGTSWTCTISGLAFNSNMVLVTARNASPTTASQTVTVGYYPTDTITVTIDPLPAYTNAGYLPMAGMVQPGANLVRVCNQTSSICGDAVISSSGGRWDYRAPLTLEGVNNFQVTATVGTNTRNVTASTVFDSTAPTLNVSTLADGSTTSAQVLNVTGVVSDTNLDTVTVNNQPVTVVNGVFSLPIIIGIPNAATSVTVEAADKAGNKTIIGPRTINFNKAKTDIVITAPADGAEVKSSTVLVSGTISTPTTVTVNGSAASVTYPNWSASVTLASSGMNTILVETGDAARVKRTVFYDAANPEISVTLPLNSDFTTKSTSVTVAGTVDASATSLTSTINGVTSAVPITSGTFSVNVPLSVEGNYPVLLTVTDASAKTSTTTRSIIFDTTPPALTINAATSPATTLSGTMEPGAIVTVKNMSTNVAVGTVTATHSGWNAALGASTDLATIYVAATDAAGNTVTKAFVKPDGDITGAGGLPNGVVDIDDARAALAIVVGQQVATPLQLAHGDIGPLVSGQSSPNGVIDIGDAVLILRKAAGLPVSW